MAQASPILGEAQSELKAQVSQLDRLRPNELSAAINGICRTAYQHELFPAAAVAHALSTALAHGERGTLIEGWLGMLGDAIASERQDRLAGEAFAAACSVRFLD